MQSSTHVAEVRLAELLAALSVGIDLAMGQPHEHVLRSALVATALARQLGLSDREVRHAYYTTLVRLVGCTGDAHETARLAAGDDVAFRRHAAVHTMGEIGELEAALPPGSGRAARTRLRAARVVALTTHCEVGELLARRLGLPAPVPEAVRSSFARWDGRGVPAGLAGEAVPVAARIAIVARDAEVMLREHGLDAARDLVRRRRGNAYAPEVADAFDACAETVATLDSGAPIWDQALKAEPRPWLLAPQTALEPMLDAFGVFADLKSPYTAGHSKGVAQLASAAALLLGLPEADRAEVQLASHVLDLGRVGVPNAIWDAPRALTSVEWERVRLHSYISERILVRCPALQPLSRLAGGHHERMDGSGYYRGSRAAEQPLSLRVVATADACRAMSEPRAYRRPWTPAETGQHLVREARTARFDRRVVDAVIEASGGATPPRSRVDELTPREIEVLRLVCRGQSNREAAALLGISAKTVGHHVQHAYEKLGVSTRAAATIKAVERGLLYP